MNITISSNESSLNRSEIVGITYQIKSCGVESIRLIIPMFFENIIFDNNPKNCKISWKDNSRHTLCVDLGGSSKEKAAEISYSAKISNSLPISTEKCTVILNQTTILINQGLGEDLIIAPCRMDIYNNVPKNLLISLTRSSDYRDEEPSMFLKDEPIDLKITVSEIEDDILDYRIFEGETLTANGSINRSRETGEISFDTNIEYLVRNSTNLSILLLDKDNGSCNYVTRIQVSASSMEERKKLDGCIYICFIVVLFIIFILLPLRPILQKIFYYLATVFGLFMVTLTFFTIDAMVFFYRLINYEIMVFIFISLYSF